MQSHRVLEWLVLHRAHSSVLLSRVRLPLFGLSLNETLKTREGSATARREMKVYTRSGDAGKSSLYTGERRRKDDTIFAALGDVDELNSCIGVAYTHLEDLIHVSSDANGLPAMGQQLQQIQSRLMDVGSAIATPIDPKLAEEQPESANNDGTRSRDSANVSAKTKNIGFDEDGKETVLIENYIDSMEEELPPLKNFILPSGGHTGE